MKKLTDWLFFRWVYGWVRFSDDLPSQRARRRGRPGASTYVLYSNTNLWVKISPFWDDNFRPDMNCE